MPSTHKNVKIAGEEQQSSSSVQTIQRASRILRNFMENEPEIGLTTISRQVGIHKSTVSRLLTSLRAEGFVEQNPESGKWRLGLGLLELAGSALNRMDLRKVTQLPIRKLASQTQETINITVLYGDEGVNIENIPSPRSIKHAGRLGRRTPLHCTSTGKIFLAFLPPEIQETFTSRELPQFTDYTIVDRQILKQELERVRSQDYAISHDEFEDGLSAVASPIRDHTGEVIAAVSISGPSYRMGPEQIEKFLDPLKEAANTISSHLGYMLPDE